MCIQRKVRRPYVDYGVWVLCTFRMFWHVPIGHVTNFAGVRGCYNVSIFGAVFVITSLEEGVSDFLLRS